MYTACMVREEVQLSLFIVTVVSLKIMNSYKVYYDTECTEQIENKNKKDR